MKRILLLLVLFLGTSYYSNAQVIDIIGKGLHGLTTENLPLTNVVNIDSVRAGAIYSWNNNASSVDVKFWDVNGFPPDGTKFNKDIINNSVFGQVNGAYYTALFENSDKNGINIDVFNNQEAFMHSFYAFIFRDELLANYKSYASFETVYFYKKGSSNPYTYNVEIDSDTKRRNITVKIPISELQDDNRVAIIDIVAGDKKYHAEETTYNAPPRSDLGNSLFIGEYTLVDVQGDVTNVEINVYSPTSSEAKEMGYQNPDSFYTNGVVVDVDKVGCTLTQGYWKNHSDCPRKGNGPERDDTWDELPDAEDTEFFLSKQNYCEVFATNPGKGGKYYILAHQYIASELNILAGANPTDIVSTFEEATAFLNKHTPQEVKDSKELQKKCVTLGGILDDYNNGIIGPGHCDDNDNASKILNVDEIEDSLDKNIMIYPNPATTIGRINFVPKENAETTVEVYNVLGQRVSVLYNEYTMGGVAVTVDYDAQRFKQGIHFVHIKNGSSSVTKKISIGK